MIRPLLPRTRMDPCLDTGIAVDRAFGLTVRTHHKLTLTANRLALGLGAGGLVADATVGDIGRIGGHSRAASVENVTLSVPQTAVLERLTVLYDSAIQVIHLFKSNMLHIGAEIFTAHIARAIRSDGLRLIELISVSLISRNALILGASAFLNRPISLSYSFRASSTTMSDSAQAARARPWAEVEHLRQRHQTPRQALASPTLFAPSR